MTTRRAFLAAAPLAAALAVPLAACQTAAPSPPQVSRAGLVGLWQFAPPPCDSPEVLELAADGRATMMDSYSGTWSLAGTALRLDMEEDIPGLGPTGNREAITGHIVAASPEARPETMDLQWNDGSTDRAWRCR